MIMGDISTTSAHSRHDMRLVADITPAYALLARSVFADMLKTSPNSRFLFILRDPVARLWSGVRQQYRYQTALGRVPEESLTRAFAEACETPFHPDLRLSNYAQTITELEAAVPPERIHYAFFETLIDPEAGNTERQDLAGFLDLEGLVLHAEERVHGTRGGMPLSDEQKRMAWQALAPCYSFLRARFGDRVPASWLDLN